MTSIRSTVYLLILCGCDTLLGVHDIVPVDAPANPSGLGFVATRIGSAEAFQVVDINADGNPDLVTPTQFFVNSTPPGDAPMFIASPTSTANLYTSVYLDLNGDQKPDLVVPNTTAVPDTVAVFPNTTPVGSSAISFGAMTTITGSVSSSGDFAGMTFGDVDGDGKTDILEFHESGTVSVYINTTTSGATSSTFANRVDLSSGLRGTVLTPQLQDLNGDGKLDVLEMVVLEPNSTFANPEILVNTSHLGVPNVQLAGGIGGIAACRPLAFADLDGDGFVDVVEACGPSVDVLRNTTAAVGAVPTFAAPVLLFTVNDFAEQLLLTDLDGDGQPDLVLAKQGNAVLDKPNLFVAINTSTSGTISFSQLVVLGAGQYDGPLIGVDVNGDGRNDIVTTAEDASGEELVVLTISSSR